MNTGLETRSNFCFSSFCFCLALIFCCVMSQPATGQETTQPRVGLDKNPPAVFALTGATVHVDSQKTIENATILVVRQRIAGVGSEAFPIDIPNGAQVVDLSGKHVYPGLIDPHIEFSVEWTSVTGTAYWNKNIRPQLKVSDWFNMDEIEHEDLRKSGITAGLFVPDGGIVRGQSAVLLAAPIQREQAMLAADVAQHVRLTVDRSFGRDYPNSPMGAVALARQTMLDAQWYRKAHQVAKTSSVDRPETNSALEALQPVVDGEQAIWAETSNEVFALRADRFAREFGLRLVLVGSGQEYRHLKEIADLSRELVVPVNFPKPPIVSSPEAASEVSLEQMMHWDLAPENPARLADAGVNFSFTSSGLDDVGNYLKQVTKAVKRGLAPETALDAMTINPAKLLGLENEAGTIEKGKLANLIVTDKTLFEAKSKITQTWVAGTQYQLQKQPLRRVDGKWEIKVRGAGQMKKLLLNVNTKNNKVTAEFETEAPKAKDSEEKNKDSREQEDIKELDDDTDEQSDNTDEKAKGSKAKDSKTKNSKVKLSAASLDGTRLTGAFDSTKFGHQGIAQLSLVIDASEEDASGRIILPNGNSRKATAKKLPPETSKEDSAQEQEEEGEKEAEEENDQENDEENDQADAEISEDEAKTETEKPDSKTVSFDVNYPLGAFGRQSAPEQPASVLITGVTIWTCAQEGNIKKGAVLFGDGKIRAVLADGEELPEADITIDGTGKHLTPGIIDCHSHSATDSGINESGQAITAEVRIGDFIDADSMNIYRQLAGGVTTINILHGSSNPIGGQNQVIKLRWGMLDEEMKFSEAPSGIKFALGENVKRSNTTRQSDRYPQTRMGVAEIIENAFRAAEEYRARQKSWAETGKGLPPRKDLELETIAEIVEGSRWIHCHSYRQDEILALIRILDAHDITIGTFQHILEGYKVAEEMAEHGAMASAFADWWAYKYEVKDAIPYAGALMHRAGVRVSFNSDDAELARHLNQEAAKAVRYGGVSEEEALKFVTLNPAMQLRIDQWVGSIEAGKHADLVLWSGHPLSNLSRCEQTWVDGRMYFDLKEDQKLRKQNREMRTALIQKILASGEKMKAKDRSTADPAKLWPRFDEHCGMAGHHFDDRQFNGLHQGHAHAQQATQQ